VKQFMAQIAPEHDGIKVKHIMLLMQSSNSLEKLQNNALISSSCFNQKQTGSKTYREQLF
jgi:hypothetical protein